MAACSSPRSIRSGCCSLRSTASSVSTRPGITTITARTRTTRRLPRRTRSRTSMPTRRPAEGIAVGRDRAADPAGDSLGLRRLDLHRADAVRRLFRQRDRRPRAARRAGQAARRSGTAWAFIAARPVEPGILARGCRHRRRGLSATSSTRRCRRACRRWPAPLYTLLDNKYYFDKFNDWFFAGGAREVGNIASTVGDRRDHRRLLRQRLGARRSGGRRC